MREQIEERLGLLFEDSNLSDITDLLNQQDTETLADLVHELADDEINIELEGDESRQCMVMSHAIASALREERDYISAEDIEAANAEFAVEQNEEVEAAESEEADEPEQEAAPETKQESIKAMVMDYVERFPDADKNEVVNGILLQREHANVNTLTVEYYKARKELGLGTVGQRGRPAGSGKLPRLVEYIQANPNTARDDVLQWCVVELGLTFNTAQNYYAAANREINGES